MNHLFFCIIIYAILIFIILGGIKKNSSHGCDELLKTLNSLRGIFALDIIIGHCVRYESCPLSPLGNFMLISVGFFFFVSGMGITRSYHTKSDYLKTFPKHRILHLVLIALSALMISTLIAYISPIYTPFRNIPDTLPVFLRAIIIRTNWYIRELLLLYVVFYITYRFFHKHRYVFISLMVLLICTVLLILEYKYSLGYTRCWFASIICFPLGIYTYENHDKISAFLNKRIGGVISIIVLMIGLSTSLFNYTSLIGISDFVNEIICALCNNILCVGFILVLMIFLSYFKPQNRIISFFTGISTEIYLYQFIFISIAEKMQLSYPWKIAFVFVFDILLSTVLHLLKNRFYNTQ